VNSTAWKSNGDAINYHNPYLFTIAINMEAFIAVMTLLWLTMDTEVKIPGADSCSEMVLFSTSVWNLKIFETVLIVLQKGQEDKPIPHMFHCNSETK
jgi:hypothetical protein